MEATQNGGLNMQSHIVDPRVSSLRAKKAGLLADLVKLNDSINALEMRAYMRSTHQQRDRGNKVPGDQSSRSNQELASGAFSSYESFTLASARQAQEQKSSMTPGLRMRAGLARELDSRLFAHMSHKVETTRAIVEWKEERIKARDTIEATELFVQSQLGGIGSDNAENQDSESDDEVEDVGIRVAFKCKLNGHHPTVRIHGGGDMCINICIPVTGARDYTFRALINDISEIWSLPETALVPRFLLVANSDPFVNNMIYDFRPHAFDPEDAVIDALSALKHDQDRGFGTQTGVPPPHGTLPWLHCQPNVSGDELSTLALTPELQPQFFRGCLQKYADLSGQPTPKLGELMGYDCFKEILLSEIGGRFDMNLAATAEEVFHKWSDKGEEGAGVADGLLSEEAFTWLLDDWDRLRRDGRVLRYDMSAMEAWKCFRKPSRFIDQRMRFFVRFDEYKEASLNARPGRSTAFLRDTFDAMDEDRLGIVRASEFKSQWSNLKVQILTEDGIKPGQSKSIGDAFRKGKKILDEFFSFPESSGADAIHPEHKTYFRLTIVYAILILSWNFVLNARRSTVREYRVTVSTRNILGRNARVGALNQVAFPELASRDDLWDWLQGPLASVVVGNTLEYGRKTAYSEYQSKEFVKNPEVGEDLKSRSAKDYNATRDFTIVDTPVGLSNRYNGKAVLTPPLVRVRQLRVRPERCPVFAAQDSAQEKCYPVYSSDGRSEEDILTYGNVSSSNQDSIMKMSTAFFWSSGEEMSISSVPYPGSQVRVISSEPRSMYDASGYYVDLPVDKAEFTSTLAKLRELEWLDREETRAVIVQFVSYYPESNIFLQANYLVEMFPSGAIRASESLRPVNLRMYDIRSSQRLVLTVLFESVVGILSYGSMLLDGIQMTWPELFGTSGPGICTFKNAVGLAIIGGSVSRILFLVLPTRLTFESEGPPDLLAGFVDLNGAADSYNIGFIIDALVSISLMVRLLSFMHHLPNCENTRLILLVIRRISETVAYYAFVFMTFLLFIAIFGHGVFGAQMKGYESYQQAVITLTMAAVGQIDFVSHYRVNSYVAGPYMVLYQVGMGLVAAKMFMVIVTQAYDEFIKESKTAVAQEEFRQYHWLEILSIVFPCIKRRSGKTGGIRSGKRKRKGKKKKKKNAGVKGAHDLEAGTH